MIELLSSVQIDAPTLAGGAALGFGLIVATTTLVRARRRAARRRRTFVTFHAPSPAGVMVQYERKRPRDCTPAEIDEFTRFVFEGETGVDISEIAAGAKRAEWLVFGRSGGQLMGAAAIKNPKGSDRERVSTASNYPLSSRNFPFELGYVRVAPAFQGQGRASELVAQALFGMDHFGLFATTTDARVRALARRRDFVEAGEPRPPEGEALVLLVRPALR